LDKDGYGRTNTAEYGKQYVHRLAYMILVGPIPEGLTIDKSTIFANGQFCVAECNTSMLLVDLPA